MAYVLRDLEQARSTDAMLALAERLAAQAWTTASGLLLRDRLRKTVKGEAVGPEWLETIRREEPA